MRKKKDLGETILYCIICVCTFGITYAMRLVISEAIRKSFED
jgi:hypothetical protein